MTRATRDGRPVPIANPPHGQREWLRPPTANAIERMIEDAYDVLIPAREFFHDTVQDIAHGFGAVRFLVESGPDCPHAIPQGARYGMFKNAKRGWRNVISGRH